MVLYYRIVAYYVLKALRAVVFLFFFKNLGGKKICSQENERYSEEEVLELKM